MARGTWDDFTEKYGFRDGEATEDRDFKARDNLAVALNAREDMRAAKLRAVPYEAPGMHNACILLILANPAGLSDEELLAQPDPKLCDLPDVAEDMDEELRLMIDAAYDPDPPPTGPFCPEHGVPMRCVNAGTSFSAYECPEGCRWVYDGDDGKYVSAASPGWEELKDLYGDEGSPDRAAAGSSARS